MTNMDNFYRFKAKTWLLQTEDLVGCYVPSVRVLSRRTGEPVAGVSYRDAVGG